MALFTFLVITYSLIDSSKCLEETIADAFGLQILPESLTNGQHVITKQVDETLHLFCRIQANKLTSNKSNMLNYKLSWKLPHLTHNSQNRVMEMPSLDPEGGWQLVIQNLKESDTGDYECLAQSTATPGIIVRGSVRVNVKNKKPRCGEGDQMFACPAGNCIVRRYVCDGHPDCRDAADEDPALCGPNACEGKIRCPAESRCIPSEWCCDHHSEPNCTAMIRHVCCPQAPKRFYPPEFTNSFTKFSDEDQQQRLHNNDDHQRFSDMGFLQTTIYTVIGCAMAFMFIVTILVIAICRVHMKRTLLSRCPNARGNARGGGRAGGGGRNHHGVAHMPLYDLDVFLNRGSPFPSELPPTHPGLLVTYNINNGVQFVGRPVDPPPYCEVVASPPREGPPPPYVSHENLRPSQHDHRDVDSADNATEADALLSRESVRGGGGNTLRITVVNTAPRGGGGGEGGDGGGRYRLVAVRTDTPPPPVHDAAVAAEETRVAAEETQVTAVASVLVAAVASTHRPCTDQAQLRKDFFGLGATGEATDGEATE